MVKQPKLATSVPNIVRLIVTLRHGSASPEDRLLTWHSLKTVSVILRVPLWKVRVVC